MLDAALPDVSASRSASSEEDALLDAPAIEQAARIRRGDLSSEELVRLYLARIARIDHALGAFVELHGERALFAARAKDRLLRRRGAQPPPFHGVPTAIKDLNFVRGMWTRMGSRAFCLWSPVDDHVTRRTREGGFVFLGKTTTSELGVLPVVEPDIHAPTRNPWDRSRTAGGSSGGAAAAVAARMLPIAWGSDGAGSIRIPSAFCGLYGMKPSRGRVPDAYGMPDRHLTYTCGPIARSVDDAAALLDVLAGVSLGPRRLHWAPPPPRPFAELARVPPPRLRVRVATRTHLGATDPEIAEATLRVAALLASMGHDVEEGTIDEGTVEEFLPVWQYAVANAPIGDWSAVQPVTRWLADFGRGLDEREVNARQEELERRVLAYFAPIDLLVTPTTPVPPPRVGELVGDTPAETFRRASVLGFFTAPFNASGQPAASVPAGRTRDGAPIGVQIVGRPFADATVLAVSRALEEAMPWRGAHAPDPASAAR